MQINSGTVELIGHFTTSMNVTATFDLENVWVSFCSKKMRIPEGYIPRIDFSAKKVVVIPTYDTRLSQFIFFNGTTLHPRTSQLEVHFYGCEKDDLSSYVLKEKAFVLAVPKDQKYSEIYDHFGNRMSNLDKHLTDLFEKNVKYSVIKHKIESATRLLRAITPHRKFPEFDKVIFDYQMNEVFLDYRLKLFHSTVIGRHLNP